LQADLSHFHNRQRYVGVIVCCLQHTGPLLVNHSQQVIDGCLGAGLRIHPLRFLNWREKVRAEPGSCFRRQKAWFLPAALADCASGARADFASL
jgi:hypothetical protein